MRLALRLRAAFTAWRIERAEARHRAAYERARLALEAARLRTILSADKADFGPGQSRRWLS